LKASSAKILTSQAPFALEGDDSIKTITVEGTKDKALTKIEVDDVICNFGFISNLGPIKE